jgi:putative DNA primase/helicase
LSVAISCLLTPVVRGCMSVAPMHVSRAPTAGTGKSFLFDTSSMITLGVCCPVLSAGKTEEETEKRIGADALAGHPIICLDNVNGILGGDQLCQLITQSICKIRILGKSETPSVTNRFCIFATGNNIQLTEDMTRRALICSLDAGVEEPGKRKFKGNPVKRVAADRGKYIAACLAIVKAYFVAGKPDMDVDPMGSFEDWSASVRGALLWLGEADPCNTIQVARAEDPAQQLLVRFFAAMQEAGAVGKGYEMSAKQLGAMAERRVPAMDDLGNQVHGEFAPKFPLLADVLEEWRERGTLNTKKLGWWLRRQKHKIVGSHKLNSSDAKDNQLWFLERIAP